MATKPHYIHVFQPPRQGAAFMATHLATGYKHRIVAKGGFDTASWTAQMARVSAEQAFQTYLGCVVRVVVDNPHEPIWEGFISRVTWRVGGQTVSRTFDGMSNRVSVVFNDADAAAYPRTAQTAVTDNLASQALYGVKQGTADGQIHRDTADKTQKVALRNTIAANRAYPQVSAATAPGGDGIIEFEAQGLQYWAWDWQTYNTAAGATTSAAAAFWRATVHTNFQVPANAPYVYETGNVTTASPFQYIDTSPAFNYSTTSQSGQTYLQFLQSIVEAGDGANPYVFGITALDPNTNTRFVYYRRANKAIVYTCYALSDSGRLRDVYGRIVPPYLVRPDAGVRINDILTGWDDAGDDPRIGYIDTIEYDADAGSVSVATGDNPMMEGVLQKGIFAKTHGSAPFSALVRNNF